MTITALMDDYCPAQGFKAEHGLSYLVESGGTRVLFDTGQSPLFLENARRLGVDLHGLDAVVLSHGHYDHTGGLGALYAAIGPDAPPFYAGEGYDCRRLDRTPEGIRDIGYEPGTGDVPPPRIVEGTVDLGSGIRILGAAPVQPGVGIPERLRKVAGGAEAEDHFEDELSLAVDLGGGKLAVLSGCAHRGIVSIAAQAAAAFPGSRPFAAAGGFHLGDAGDEYLDRVTRSLRGLGTERVLCGHCTGPRGYAALAREFGRDALWLRCGARIEM